MGSRIVHIVSKAVLSFIMLFSVYNYLFNYELLAGGFALLGYPAYLIYPLAFLKLAGLFVLWFSQSQRLIEWTYAGFAYLLVLGFFAHVMVGDGNHLFAFISFVGLVVAYITK